MRWKLLIRYLFSEFLLQNSDVKLRLVSKRLEVRGQNIIFGDIQKSVDESGEYLQSVDVAFEKLVTFKNVDDFLFEFLDE